MINRVHQKRMAPTGGEMESANCPTKVSTSASSFSTLKKIEFIHSENRYDVSFFFSYCYKKLFEILSVDLRL